MAVLGAGSKLDFGAVMAPGGAVAGGIGRLGGKRPVVRAGRDHRLVKPESTIAIIGLAAFFPRRRTGNFLDQHNRGPGRSRRNAAGRWRLDSETSL
jgi:hypothetical protein